MADWAGSYRYRTVLTRGRRHRAAVLPPVVDQHRRGQKVSTGDVTGSVGAQAIAEFGIDTAPVHWDTSGLASLMPLQAGLAERGWR
jgi:hypothetical protein